ncbi:hypothetical protein CYMTET_41059 [Cymbomonas tetramitiformis]|uniref:Uncharacterized protein n=1 Tax=Cymbomonas tetramitiformis TaxID=36881 RepID=A0AAE0C6T1_9CHLO|nr:hypothetical protein CYMTET_41059 [Cymbomonas tetramitiformis]
MQLALSHFRHSENSEVSSAASPPISLQIVVSDTCTVVGGAQDAGSAAVDSDRQFDDFDSSVEDDESEYPVGYFDDSEDSLVAEERDVGHLAPPLFSDSGLEQEELGTGSQLLPYGGVLDPSLEDDFLPQNDFDDVPNSFVEPLAEAEDEVAEFSETITAEYAAEEWAAWDAEAHDSYDSGGADFYDGGYSYEESYDDYSGDGYY